MSDSDGMSDDEGVTLDELTEVMEAASLKDEPSNKHTQLEWGGWCKGDHSVIILRGLDYLKDNNSKNEKAKKIPAGENLFDLINVELLPFPDKQCGIPHIAGEDGGYLSRTLADYKKQTTCDFVVVNFMIPGSIGMNLVLYFQRKLDFVNKFPAFERLWTDFLNGDQKWRDDHIKFIPNVVEGNWLVKKSVGRTPAIIGNKLDQSYHGSIETGYIEIDIDVGSSKVARSLLALVEKYTSSLVIEFFFLLEGQTIAELPEKLIGGVRLDKVDLSCFTANKKTENSSDTDA